MRTILYLNFLFLAFYNKAVHQTPFTTAFYHLNALYFGLPNHHIKMNIQATIGIVAPYLSFFLSYINIITYFL